MSTTWQPIFDQSFNRVPFERLPEMYARGFRGMAGYAGGGSSDKWLTAAEIAAWKACGPGAFICPLFEVAGTEPIDYPSMGTAHAHAARTAWARLGLPAHIALVPAVDENVGASQWQGALAKYFKLWTLADVPPVAYVEADAGASLFAAGCTAGTMTPAAYRWSVPALLYTPANAPRHVVWTQEHNGVRLAGGEVDTGHIRTTAACVWWLDEGTDPMAMVTIPAGYSDTGKQITLEEAIESLMRYEIQIRNTVLTIAKGDAQVIDTDELAAQLAPKLGGSATLDQIKAGLSDVLSSVHVVVAPAAA